MPWKPWFTSCDTIGHHDVGAPGEHGDDDAEAAERDHRVADRAARRRQRRGAAVGAPLAARRIGSRAARGMDGLLSARVTPRQTTDGAVSGISSRRGASAQLHLRLYTNLTPFEHPRGRFDFVSITRLCHDPGRARLRRCPTSARPSRRHAPPPPVVLCASAVAVRRRTRGCRRSTRRLPLRDASTARRRVVSRRSCRTST